MVQVEHARAVHHHVWFGPEERRLSGWWTAPADGRVHGVVLLCQPIGDESRSSRRTFRVLAEQLAHLGLGSLRFDYDGLGDSAGATNDPDPVRRWSGSISSALAWLRSRGFDSVHAVGMRLGATLLASMAVEHQLHFDSLVLWDPASAGRRFLREGAAVAALAEGVPVDPADGLVHTPGYTFDAAAADSVGTLDLASLPEPPRAERTLVLLRDDRPFPAKALASLMRAKAAEQGVALDQAALLDVAPTESEVPFATVHQVASWLAGAAAGARTEVVADLRLDEVPSSPVVEAFAIGGEATTPVEERSRWLLDGAIFAIETVPRIAVSGPQPWIVLFNVASEDHTGPGRLWVRLARHWAGMGFRVIRLDLSGAGDSPPRAGRPDASVYDPAWLLDGPEIVAELGRDGSPVCLIGICSGSYTAFESALTAPAPLDAVVAINPTVTLYHVTRSQPLYSPMRRAVRLPWNVLGVLARRRRILVGGIWRSYRQLAFWNAPLRPIRQIAARGTSVLLIGNGHDVGQFTEVVVWHLLRLIPRRWSLRGRLGIQVDQGLDHPVLTAAGREATDALVTAFLRRHYVRYLADVAVAEVSTEAVATEPVAAAAADGRTDRSTGGP